MLSCRIRFGRGYSWFNSIIDFREINKEQDTPVYPGFFVFIKFFVYRDVYQLVDSLVWDQEAVGSSPAIPTTRK